MWVRVVPALQGEAGPSAREAPALLEEVGMRGVEVQCLLIQAVYQGSLH
jgi:hypothetical protein